MKITIQLLYEPKTTVSLVSVRNSDTASFAEVVTSDKYYITHEMFDVNLILNLMKQSFQS